MSLQERTLVVKNFDSEKTSQNLLKELCLQAGPVRNVVIRQDHAFVEFEDVESVGFSKALLDGVMLHGKKLYLEPKLKTADYYKYTKLLQDYIKYDKQQRALEESSRIQPFQTTSPRVWSPNSSTMNIYPTQSLVSSQQYVIPFQQMPTPIVGSSTQQQTQPFIQANGFIQPPNYISPFSQTPINFIHNQPDNHQYNQPKRQRSFDSWSRRRR